MTALFKYTPHHPLPSTIDVNRFHSHTKSRYEVVAPANHSKRYFVAVVADMLEFPDSLSRSRIASGLYGLGNTLGFVSQ